MLALVGFFGRLEALQHNELVVDVLQNVGMRREFINLPVVLNYSVVLSVRALS